ncbi:SHOCT domain-containing protein [Nesterenkonia sp. LB17]|uniref:SHOCT domain-containing protein n=1 Tax=unclassified Nesterenkonia TaxID=2629769 RepID=UPI001F4C629A|nr:SHOCT domain-containing protein [Nesterenkonia sp. LB17]MCH8570205.1 SHOCT domain-containing protein [Nesterenkonia sp. AY15]
MTIERVGRPGLIGLAARTSVLLGATQALTGEGDVYQQRRARDRDDQEHYAAAHQQARIEAAALAAIAHAAPPAPLAPVPLAVPSGTSFMDDLQRLAELRRSGLLSEEEFAAAKGKLLR